LRAWRPFDFAQDMLGAMKRNSDISRKDAKVAKEKKRKDFLRF
jgi:hypothetical protein